MDIWTRYLFERISDEYGYYLAGYIRIPDTYRKMHELLIVYYNSVQVYDNYITSIA
jgi:hypothetical protein